MRKCKKLGFLFRRNVSTHMREKEILANGGKDRVIPLEKRFNLFTLFPLIISRNSIKLSHMNLNEKVPEYMLCWNNFLLSDLNQKVSNGKKIRYIKINKTFPIIKSRKINSLASLSYHSQCDWNIAAKNKKSNIKHLPTLIL